MDPQACLERLIHAINDNDADEMNEAYHDLRVWISNQGFEPKWSAGMRNAFYMGLYTFKNHVLGGNE